VGSLDREIGYARLRAFADQVAEPKGAPSGLVFARSESHEAIETASAEKVSIASLTLAMTPEVDRAPSIRSDRRPL
jgi:hypothetical protein